MEFTRFEDQVFLTTVLIENLSDNSIGTGFMVKKPVTETGSKVLLFSNKHVFWGKKDQKNMHAKKELKITLHRKNSDETYTLGTVQAFRFEISRDQNEYKDHPDTDVDVAAINITGLCNQGIPLNILALNYKDFSTFERNDLVSGDKILFVGYPSGFYDQKNFLPILRIGGIASIPSVDFNGKPQILVDAQVFPGSSGSPVFVQFNGHYKLLGIISDAFNKDIDFLDAEIETTSSIVEKKTVSLPKEWVGLGLLFTNDTIKEVYELI